MVCVRDRLRRRSVQGESTTVPLRQTRFPLLIVSSLILLRL